MVTFDSTDLDNAVSQSGVVHENTSHTSHSNASLLEQGYPISNPMFSSSLVGYWPLQETSGSTAYDFSGNNNNGTANGGAGPSGTGTQPAPLGTTAWQFDGTDDYMDSSSSQFNVTNFTVGAWVYPTSANGNQIISRWEGGSNGMDAFNMFVNSSNQIEMQIGYSSPNQLVDVTTNSITLSKWHLAVGSWDGSTLKLYADGNSPASKTNNVSIHTGSFPLQVGVKQAGGYGAVGYFDGRIGMAFMSNAVYTNSQVQQLYNVVNTAGTLTTQYKPV